MNTCVCTHRYEPPCAYKRYDSLGLSLAGRLSVVCLTCFRKEVTRQEWTGIGGTDVHAQIKIKSYPHRRCVRLACVCTAVSAASNDSEQLLLLALLSPPSVLRSAAAAFAVVHCSKNTHSRFRILPTLHSRITHSCIYNNELRRR